MELSCAIATCRIWGGYLERCHREVALKLDGDAREGADDLTALRDEEAGERRLALAAQDPRVHFL